MIQQLNQYIGFRMLISLMKFGLLHFALLFMANTNALPLPLRLVSSEGPPHTINHPEFSGIDLDVTKSVLAAMGYSAKLDFVALGRAEKLVRSGKYDLMAPIFFAQDSNNFYISDPIVTYKPMVFSLRKNNFEPKSILDLANHSVLTFQGAPGYFGTDFAAMAKAADYVESPDMSMIADMLAKGRYDFAVLDQYIFYYFYRLNDKNRSIDIFTQHYLIPPVTASVAFKDKALRDQFNHALKQFKQGTRYASIVEAYLGTMEQVAVKPK